MQRQAYTSLINMGSNKAKSSKEPMGVGCARIDLVDVAYPVWDSGRLLILFQCLHQLGEKESRKSDLRGSVKPSNLAMAVGRRQH